MSLAYSYEKFLVALQTLAGSGARPKRIASAMMSIGNLIPPHNMPTPELQAEFDSIYSQATERGTFEETASSLSEPKASKLVDDILNVYDTLTRMRGAEDATGGRS